MPPNAAVNEGMGGGVDVLEYRSMVEGGDVVRDLKVVEDAEFSLADFRPVKELGSGDMGTVVLVQQKNSKVPYAMKVMRKNVMRVRKNAHRAETERVILRSVNHPFLPVLHSSFEDEKHSFIVMNYCHGGDLNVLRKMQPERRFSENATRFYVAEVLLAFEYLHKHDILYRDLKPENVLIQPDGHIMLTDFDLSLDLSKRKWAKPVASSTGSSPASTKKSKARSMKAFFTCASPASLSTKSSKKVAKGRITPEDLYLNRKRVSGNSTTLNGPTNSFVGTEEYIAPEIIWGMGHGLPVDWWTLGVFLYELFYGKSPFKGVNRKETFFNILCRPATFPGEPSELNDLVRKLLVKEPQERLGTNGGAEEIKKHPFFSGVNWEELQFVSRPPVVPEPFSWRELEERMAIKRRALGEEAESRWSFFEPSETIPEERKHFDGVSPSGPLSLTCGASSSRGSYADSMTSKSLREVDTAPSTPRNYSSEVESGRESVFSLHSHSDTGRHSKSRTPKEEVRLDDDITLERTLFEDVF